MGKRDHGRRPHPAPDRLRVVQELLNTRTVGEAGADGLSSPRALAEWLARHGLLAADESLDPKALEQARSAREGLRALVRGHVGTPDVGTPDVGTPVQAAAVEELNRVFGGLTTHLRFAGDSLAVVTPETGWPGALAGLLLVVHEAMASDRWRRLKACRDPECRRVFYDASRNRSGAWCDARCGDKINARSYRKRGPAWKTGRLTMKTW